jgi:hypothetical protein
MGDSGNDNDGYEDHGLLPKERVRVHRHLRFTMTVPCSQGHEGQALVLRFVKSCFYLASAWWSKRF